MRRILAFLVIATLARTAAAADVSFVRVWPQWHEADAFDRISEYFGGKENDGRQVVVRTHAEQRAGMYFLIRVKSANAIPGGKLVLEIIRPDAPDPKTFSFPVDIPAKSTVVQLGLTDGDWPGGRQAKPVAWKLSLTDSAGQNLVTQKSILWEKPAQ